MTYWMCGFRRENNSFYVKMTCIGWMKGSVKVRKIEVLGMMVMKGIVVDSSTSTSSGDDEDGGNGGEEVSGGDSNNGGNNGAQIGTYNVGGSQQGGVAMT